MGIELTTTQPDVFARLLPFCDMESTRFAINEPWVHNGWIYATDSRVLIAVPTTEPDSPLPADGRRRPNCAQIVQMFAKTETPHDFPVLPVCFTCESTGLVNVSYHKCQRCDGEGMRNIQKPHGMKTVVCRDCHGEGLTHVRVDDPRADVIQPEPCEGRFCGFSEWSKPVDFARHYLLMIRNLLGPELKCGIEPDGVVFVAKANGIIAILMGRRPDLV